MGNVFRSNSYSNIQKRQYDDASQMSHEGRGIVSLKYEAQKIRDFTGLTMDWTKWKNRTECKNIMVVGNLPTINLSTMIC